MAAKLPKPDVLSTPAGEARRAAGKAIEGNPFADKGMAIADIAGIVNLYDDPADALRLMAQQLHAQQLQLDHLEEVVRLITKHQG